MINNWTRYLLCVYVFALAGVTPALALTLSVNEDATSVVSYHSPFASDLVDEIQDDPDSLVIMNFKFAELGIPDTTFDGPTLNSVSISGAPLPYPNPMRINGSVDPYIEYYLNKAAPIEFRLYDIRGNELYKESFASGLSNVSFDGYNRFALEFEQWGLGELPSSVYFFLFISEGDVIGKGKFVIRP